MYVCLCVCVCGVCDVIRQNGDREEPSWRRQYVSLDVCTRMTPSLCPKDRTDPKIVMDSDFGASAKGELGSARPTEVRTLTIDREPREADRCILGDYWKGRQPQHTGLSDDLKLDSGRAGLRRADEGRISPTAGGRRREQSPTASCYYMAAEVDREQSQAALPSSLVRWNRFSSPCHNSTEDQPVSTQEGAAAQDQETSD